MNSTAVDRTWEAHSSGVSLLLVIGLLLAPIFGAWLVGHEYRQGTLRRVLAVDARRNRLLATKAGLGVVANLSGVGDLTVDGISGDDTLIVLGTTGVDGFTISTANVTHDSLQDVDTITNIDALTVSGGEGADTFGVTAGALPIFIDGGDPVGTSGDALTIAAADNSVK